MGRLLTLHPSRYINIRNESAACVTFSASAGLRERRNSSRNGLKVRSRGR